MTSAKEVRAIRTNTYVALSSALLVDLDEVKSDEEGGKQRRNVTKIRQYVNCLPLCYTSAMTIDFVVEVIARLRRLYPGGGALEVGTPYHMLVMVILSARTRDEQVLKLAPAFFSKFPKVEVLANAPLSEVTAAVSSIGMYKQKAKNVSAMAKMLVERFHGEVPSTMDELTSLPGVGRKTASVILVAVFNEPAIAVDVHVARIAQRLGWTMSRTPVHIEQDLLKKIPRHLWSDINHTFVSFGRAICTVGAPRCFACPLVDICPFADKQLTTPPNADAIMAAARAKEELIERLKADVRRVI